MLLNEITTLKEIVTAHGLYKRNHDAHVRGSGDCIDVSYEGGKISLQNA